MKATDTIIFECLYAQGQTLSDPLFTPLVIANEHPEWRELQAFLEIYRRGDWRERDFVGVFSPKFALKCPISVNQFRDFVNENAGADVCLINPFPQIAYWSYNVWIQGEHAHTGLGSAAQMLLDAIGIPWRLSEVPRHGPNLLSYGSFWVARTEVWQAFVGDVLQPIADYLQKFPKDPAVVGILRPTRHTDEAPFLPFMIERLFSTFLSFQPNWKVAAIQASEQEILDQYCLNDFERLLFSIQCAEIKIADELGLFTKPLVNKMNSMCALYQQHFNDFYLFRVHPHSGKTMPT